MIVFLWWKMSTQVLDGLKEGIPLYKMQKFLHQSMSSMYADSIQRNIKGNLSKALERQVSTNVFIVFHLEM